MSSIDIIQTIAIVALLFKVAVNFIMDELL